MDAEQEYKLDQLLANDPDVSGNSLNDWELQFIENLHQTMRKEPLSPKQLFHLTRIYERVC